MNEWSVCCFCIEHVELFDPPESKQSHSYDWATKTPTQQLLLQHTRTHKYVCVNVCMHVHYVSNVYTGCADGWYKTQWTSLASQ